MSDSWISWNPRIDEPSKPSPSSKTSSVSSCAGTEKCCMSPGRSQNRTSTTSMFWSFIVERTSFGVPAIATSFPLHADVSAGGSTSRFQCAAHRVGDQARHHVRVHVCVGPAVLDVALLVELDLPRDAHRRPAVGHAVVVFVPGRGLMEAGQPVLDVGAVVLDMLRGLLAERLTRLDDRGVALAHLLRRE